VALKTAFVSGVAIAFVGLATASAAPPPASAFGRLPQVQDAAISPDGSKVAMVGGAGDRRIISIAPVDGTQALAVDIGRASVRSLSWAGNNYLLVRSSLLQQWKNAAAGGQFTYHMDRDFVLGSDGQVIGQLLNNSAASAAATGLPIRRIIDGAEPKAIVLGLDVNSRMLMKPTDTRLGGKDEFLLWSLWKVDVRTGVGHVVERGGETTADWIVDLQGEPRVRFEQDPVHHAAAVLVRSKSSRTWTTLLSTADTRTHPLPELLGYSDPEDAAYVVESAPGGGLQVVRHGLADGATSVVGPAGAFSDLDLRFDPYTDAPVAVVGGGGGTAATHWLDPRLGGLAAKLGKAFPGKVADFYDWSRDRSRILVSVESADSPPAWYLLEAAKGQLSPVASSYPELDGVPLGTTTWFTFKARDGLDIPAYLTLPPAGQGPRGRLPLIVLPHGGPAARDDAGFDWWTQFLASRGYAVLRPQYRGSRGFGADFERAGRKEWGGKMQTDLLDGIADLAAKGVIDPGRVCIVGASYGGYAALTGAALHPEAYRCAASVNGISDVGLFLGETIHSYGRDSDSIDYWRESIGDVRSDAALIAAVSPARRAAEVRGPILLVAAEEDTTVPFEQSVTMRKALTAAGKSVEMVSLPGDDHYLSTSATRTKMLESLDAFLAKNLPVN
jgi:dipeptidyl aminopeptidase/acylaminoacyl peptidase